MKTQHFSSLTYNLQKNRSIEDLYTAIRTFEMYLTVDTFHNQATNKITNVTSFAEKSALKSNVGQVWLII